MIVQTVGGREIQPPEGLEDRLQALMAMALDALRRVNDDCGQPLPLRCLNVRPWRAEWFVADGGESGWRLYMDGFVLPSDHDDLLAIQACMESHMSEQYRGIEVVLER
jgi:hypothetical protein